MSNVPLFLGGAAVGLMNDLADYLLNDAASPFGAGNPPGISGTTASSDEHPGGMAGWLGFPRCARLQ